MKKLLLTAMAFAMTVSIASAEIRGQYIETRNAEIYASHCFANSEAGIAGDLAVMAWRIEAGEMNGVSLDGQHVVAVVKASATLGDPFANPLPTKTMLIFGEDASAEQRAALTAFAKKSGGELIEDVVRTEIAPISLDFHGDMHAKQASLTAGEIVKLTTRPIESTDSLCHLDNIYYGPLVELDHAMPAFAIEASFQGEGMGVKLNDYRRSSVYMGSFTAADKQLSDD